MKTNETLAQGIDAVATSDLPGLWLEGTSVPKWGLGLFFVFLLLNALFVAYRQAILRVKVAADLQEDEQSEAAADKIVDKIGDRTEYHLQVAQVGITLCSLALGYFAAPFFAHFLHGLLLNSGLDMPVRLLKAIALGFSFLLVAFFLLLLGEFIPKTVGIRAPLSVAKFFGLPLQAISYPLRPFVWLAEGSSNFVLRHFLRMEPAVESELAHSAEELGEIISEAEESDEVTETERKILLNALELNDLLVRDVMTPRGSVLTLDIDDSFEQNLQVAVESNYSRLPLVKEHLDHTLGLVMIKDLLPLAQADNANDSKIDLRDVRREVLRTNETTPLDHLLATFLSKRAQMALVLDEYGGAAGIVTLEDVMEEIVGDIYEEFEDVTKPLTWVEQGQFITEGQMPLNDFSDLSKLEFNAEDASTIGGYVTEQIGYLPQEGETTELHGYRVTITQCDGRRILEMRWQEIPEEESSEASAA